MSVLDVGCGPGSITNDLAGMVAPGPVVGLDSAQSAVDAAVAAFGRDGVEFVRGEVGMLPFADGAFDVVHAHQVLQHLTDPIAALGEMARVCRAGGLIAARDADYQAMTWYPDSQAIADWLYLYRTMATANGAQPDAGRRLGSWAHAAGLAEIDAGASTWCYSTPEQRQWWAGQWAERLQTESFLTQATRRGVDGAAVHAMAEGFGAWAEEPDGWFVVVHGDLLATPGVRS